MNKNTSPVPQFSFLVGSQRSGIGDGLENFLLGVAIVLFVAVIFLGFHTGAL
jgi:hypothetical protein